MPPRRVRLSSLGQPSTPEEELVDRTSRPNKCRDGGNAQLLLSPPPSPVVAPGHANSRLSAFVRCLGRFPLSGSPCGVGFVEQSVPGWVTPPSRLAQRVALPQLSKSLAQASPGLCETPAASPGLFLTDSWIKGQTARGLIQLVSTQNRALCSVYGNMDNAGFRTARTRPEGSYVQPTSCP